jgi:hypothetical protein
MYAQTFPSYMDALAATFAPFTCGMHVKKAALKSMYVFRVITNAGKSQ